MSRPRLLPPLAAETVAFLESVTVPDNWIAPRNVVNAEAHPLLVQLMESRRKSEKHLRVMDAAHKNGELETFGTVKGKPVAQAAQWARRKLDNFNELCRVACEAGDDALELHLAAIDAGMNAPGEELAARAIIRKRVFLAHKICTIQGREPFSGKPYVPTAGEIAAFLSESSKVMDLSTKEVVNHLKALRLPYAPAQRGKRKSI
jgi:hypothetical protein